MYQWQMAQYILINSLPVPADTSFLHHLPTTPIPLDSGFANHPAVQYAESQLAYDRSREDVLKKSYLPRLTVWGTASGRGSGFESNGEIKTWDGMGLSRFNYGAGFQLSFPIYEIRGSKKATQ